MVVNSRLNYYRLSNHPDNCFKIPPDYRAYGDLHSAVHTMHGGAVIAYVIVSISHAPSVVLQKAQRISAKVIGWLGWEVLDELYGWDVVPTPVEVSVSYGQSTARMALTDPCSMTYSANAQVANMIMAECRKSIPSSTLISHRLTAYTLGDNEEYANTGNQTGNQEEERDTANPDLWQPSPGDDFCSDPTVPHDAREDWGCEQDGNWWDGDVCSDPRTPLSMREAWGCEDWQW